MTINSIDKHIEAMQHDIDDKKKRIAELYEQAKNISPLEEQVHALNKAIKILNPHATTEDMPAIEDAE